MRAHLISSDYEGCDHAVRTWTRAPRLNEYEAHDKRIWSVDYCTSDPLLFVSGSDDGYIKASSRACTLPFLARSPPHAYPHASLLLGSGV